VQDNVRAADCRCVGSRYSSVRGRKGRGKVQVQVDRARRLFRDSVVPCIQRVLRQVDRAQVGRVLWALGQDCHRLPQDARRGARERRHAGQDSVMFPAE